MMAAPNAATDANHEMTVVDTAVASGSIRIGRHATMTAAMKVQRPYLQCFLMLVTIAFGGAAPVDAQALHTEHLANGTLLIVVAEPLSDATTVAWPAAGDEGVHVITSGEMTLITDLEAALSLSPDGPAPPVVITAGGVPLAEIRGVLERTLAGRHPSPAALFERELVDEARMERRLGAPGSEAEIRLHVNLPEPSDPTRTSAEVLWDLLPEVLAGDLRGLQSRTAGDQGILEARVDADRVDVALSQLRIGLARISEDPRLQADQVEAASRRLLVQRRAFLEKHPQAALRLLELWTEGGVAAVREYLFAAEGVTLGGVREVARTWLPQHPGSVIVVLPPQALNPRFASPPNVMQLDSGLTAAILERAGTPLSVVCLRPVVVPDLDDNMAATILTRVARELRAGTERPGWVAIETTPPRLEIAAPAAGFAELVEALRSATDNVAQDQRAIPLTPGDARRRALRLTAGLLGVAEGSELTPITLLRQENLALGVVAEDGEAAAEAVRKFWAKTDGTIRVTSVRPLPPVPKTREAVAGSESAVVLILDTPVALGETPRLVLAELVFNRASVAFAEADVEVLAPYVPGRSVVLLVVTEVSPLEELERRLRETWTELISPADEEELVPVRRRIAATAAARWSGATGRARRCAAIAAGAAGWQQSSEMEMSILTVSVDTVNMVLSGLGQWEDLQVAAAGVLPIVELAK